MREIHQFLSCYQDFRRHCDSVDYNGLVNPVDSVFYPGVSLDIPQAVWEEVYENLCRLEGVGVRINAMFLRLSLAGVEAPHQAHTDATMGQKSMMLYLNRDEDCQGGTSLLKHESGMYRNPINAEEEAVWRRDTNVPEAWQVKKLCEMRPNKACIFDAALMHRAEPIGGFGTDASDGRLVLTAFYDC